MEINSPQRTPTTRKHKLSSQIQVPKCLWTDRSPDSDGDNDIKKKSPSPNIVKKHFRRGTTDGMLVYTCNNFFL